LKSPFVITFLVSTLLLSVGCERVVRLAEKPGMEEPGERISFNTHIQPILSENCYHCHGPDSGTREPKSEPLRLDREQFAFEVREDGKPVIVKGDPDASLLLRLMKSQDLEEIMPPPKSHKQLTPEQIAVVERWIEQGAEYEEHWSFIPPSRPEIPPVTRPEAVSNPVDTFIQKKLADHRLAPAPSEDPRVLARRAALDLTGLLPDPADVEAFAKDPSDVAYADYLEKLFKTPAYAEHRARYWLDYSRYADTHGLHFDNVRSIWPYRDYVIRSFAANKSYDDFVREQLAGDLLSATSAEPWIATGYIRCNVSTNEGGTIPEEIHANNTRDRAEAFGAAFLGLTVGCAACHDHKFDPTSQKDFYSLSAYFNNTSEKPWDENTADTKPVLRLPGDEKKRAQLDESIARRSKAAAAYEQLRQGAPSQIREWLAAGNKPTPVSHEALELRLRLDEGQGKDVKNSAPSAKTAIYQTDTNPPVWGDNVWFWPAMRMDISTNLLMPDQGDFEADERFSTSMWTLLRMKTANATTGNGSLISRMGDAKQEAHRGWDMFIEGDKLVVHLIHRWPDEALRVLVPGIPRGEWIHLGFSYDGSRKAEGIKVYVNGQSKPTQITQNHLPPGRTIRTQLAANLGRRHASDPMREVSLQDVRLYRRAVTPEEFTRLPFEDPAAEILAASPEPEKWSSLQRFVVLDRFFLAQAPDARKLQDEIRSADAEIEMLTKDGTATLITKERPTPATAWVFNRGVFSDRKELVTPATPEFMAGAPAGASRLDLADWLFKPENPLFARVTVNRIWQEVFGVGLVETADDFGIMGARPTHPELLDWLAVEFRESGWNLKHIYQLLLTSATYRQSNRVTPEALAADPANRLLSRGPRFRMDAEVLRDTALQASGLLAGRVGGPPVKPYQPDGIWEAVSMPESNTLKYKRDDGEALYRRSLYTFWKRFAPPPSLETFDAQAREVVCVRRARTNTPLQALVSMNDPQFVEAARKLAERAILHGSHVDERLDFLSKLLLSRSLDVRERADLSKRLEGYVNHYREHPQDATELLKTGTAPVQTGLNAPEVAAWTMMSNQFLNLDETLTK
jgi:hypothetical protein